MHFLPFSDAIPPCQAWVQLLQDPSDGEVAVLRLVGSVGDKKPPTWQVVIQPLCLEMHCACEKT